MNPFKVAGAVAICAAVATLTSFGASPAHAASCQAMQSELRSLERSGGSSAARQKLRQQQAALAKVDRALRSNNCGSRRSNVCRQYEAAKRQMLGNIRVYQRRAGGGNEARAASLRRTISRQCSGRKQRNVLDVLFGNPRAKEVPQRTATARVARSGSGRNVNPARTSGTRTPRASWNNGSRSMCVRLSDGYFWPVSTHTRQRGLTESEKECQAACPGQEVALYIHPMNSETDQLVAARTGQPYAALETANAYRSAYNAQAQCGVGVERKTIASPPALPRSLRIARMEASGLSPLTVLPMPRPDFDADGNLIVQAAAKAPEASTVRVVGPQFLSDRLIGSIDPDQDRPSVPSGPS